MLPKLVISFSLLVIGLIAPFSAFAQNLPPSPLPLPASIPPTSPLYTDLLVNNLFHSFSCLAIGQSVIGQPCLTYQVTKNAQGTVRGVPVLSQVNLSGGALGASTSLIGVLFVTPPIKTADYLASVGNGLGIVRTADAQVIGSGSQVLNPILKLWQVSRNISYVFMIVIFVVIGLMIMFRNKLNPQTVITAQAALPGLVIALIMITFSYFFAALLVDTAFLGTNVVGAYFAAAQESSPSNLNQDLEKQNVLSIMSTFIGAIGQGDLHKAVSEIIGALGPGPDILIRSFSSFLAYQYAFQSSDLPVAGVSALGCAALATAGTINIGPILGTSEMTWSNVPNCIVNATLVGKQAAGAAAALVALVDPSTAISWALYVILIAVLIYTMFKLLFRLVTCFISIIFYTIFAPFQFLVAALPGRQGVATGWFLNMLANILAFPAVIGVFYFVNYLFGSGATGFLTGKPPFPVTGGPLDLTENGALPLFGNMTTNFIRLILAYGLLLATPSIPDIIARAMGRTSQAGQLIGQEIGGGLRSGRQYAGQYGQSLQGIGTAASGQRQWGWDYHTGQYDYVQTQQGMIGQIRHGINRLRGTPAAQAGRDATTADPKET